MSRSSPCPRPWTRSASRAAVDAGITTLGENRVQEAESKVAALSGVTWHLVGPLQSNKARRALETFDVIQTVDSIGLAERLDRLAREVRDAGPAARYPVLVQVNVDDDPVEGRVRAGGAAGRRSMRSPRSTPSTSVAS